jgi:hypothetical protein
MLQEYLYMALDFLKGAAQGIVGSSLKKVAGNLPGLLGFGQGKGVGIPSSTSQQTHKYVSKNLSFPLDTEAPAGANGNHGHYIMFYINQQQNAKLSFSDPEKKEGGSIASIKGQQKIPEYIKKRSSSGSYVKVENNSGLKDQALDGVDPGMVKALKEIEKRKIVRAKGSTVAINRPPTTRLDTAIAMYMPQQVQVVYGAKYTDTEIGAGAAIGMNAITDIMNDKSLEGAANAASGASGQLKGEALEGINRAALKGAGAVLPGMTGLNAANDMRRSSIKAPRMELAFEGIGKRSFQYTFKMMPRNQAEADEIRKIIFAFKSNMLPEFLDGNRAGRRLTTPNTFDIQYMYNGAENQYLHKISTCVCTNVTVAYGGDRYKTFDGVDGDGAPPVDTSITLNFQELEIITRERVYEGF